MADTFRISAKTFEGAGFLRNVLRDMRHSTAFQKKIMVGLGSLALAYAQNAFNRQALGTEIWPERYPKQTGAKVNIAGIISDFKNGKKNPPDRRFQARPAGIDTGMLLRSLTPAKAMMTTGFSVTVGSVMENASAVQFGGESKIPITKSITELLAAAMRTSRGRIKKAKKVSQPITAKDAGLQRLGFIFGLFKKGKPLVTKSAPRPYLGVTNELEDKMILFIVDTFEDFNKGKNRFVRK